MDANTEICCICHKTVGNMKVSKLTQKGCAGINDASVKRKDTVHASTGDFVHIECRRTYTNSNLIARDTKENQCPNTRFARSKADTFNFQEHCLFCGHSAKYSDRKRGFDVFPVRTLEFQKTIINTCSTRGDNWADIVRGRIEYASDLPAVDAVYHQSCSINFRTNKDIPKCYLTEPQSIKSPTRGRPTNEEALLAFKQVIFCLEESDDEQITVSDLVDKMKQICGEKAYGVSYTKQKLKEHYGESVIITDINGKIDVVTLRRTAASILHDFYSQGKLDNTETQKLNLLKAAAKIIKSDVKGEKSVYPNPDDVSSVDSNKQFVPESLLLFLRELFSAKNADVKFCSIGQAIMQACRPRTLIAPLQLGLAVQLHHHFASKYLIDVLYSLGFCVSYPEVQMFETSAVVTSRTNIENYTRDMFIQYVGDNVDHNLRTLDGHNTFHGMGIIACVTPGNFGNKVITRQQVTAEELLSAGRINIDYYKAPDTCKSSLIYTELKLLDVSHVYDCNRKITYLLQLTWPLRKPGPEWSGLMQMIRKGEYPGKSSVVLLPMIDMDPTDMSCIFTTLKYVSSHAYKYRQTAVITFDQPLYWKAVTIVSSVSDNTLLTDMVVRLGGFHCMMSYLGCIGGLMSGSGLNVLFETVYASNVIPHMMSGKAVARAYRGHSLAATALCTLLMRYNTMESLAESPVDENNNVEVQADDSQNINTAINTQEHYEVSQSRLSPDMSKMRDMYEKLISGEISPQDVYDNTILDELFHTWIDTKKRLLVYPTAALWIQYLETIDILRKFIFAERTGQWELSLQSLNGMLPYFAAAGHNMYLKSVYHYLETMQKLPESHPIIYQAFKNGLHVVRRSDRYWAGLWPDLVIEQVLMRSAKTTGGMTHGKGLSESQRTQWLLSMPLCVEMNNAMQLFCGKEFCTSPQHKEFGKARNNRDHKDTQTFLSFLEERSPFREDPLLFNIETGVTSSNSVNAHKAKSIGDEIVKSMIGQDAFEIKFKRNNKAVTLDAAQQTKTDNDIVKVDPQLLFQRLSTAAQRFVDDIPNVFNYELCSVPSSLFDTSGLIRKSQKSLLADSIWNLGNCSAHGESVATSMTYVLDGGSLLHHVPWKVGMLFHEICKAYLGYIAVKYSRAVVVFDGYQAGPTTKDTAHIRRTHGVVGPKVYFTKCTPLATKKDKFLSNMENKQNFIFMLAEELESNGYSVVHAVSDADLLIVETALRVAETSDVTIIGEDTDILVLLLHYITPGKNIFFKSAKSVQNSKGLRVWNIQKAKDVLGARCSRILPVIHAITGCDTTSQMYGISKGSALKKFLSNEELVTLAEVFLDQSCEENISKAGENIIVGLYGGIFAEGLDLLRFRKFTRKVMGSSTPVQVQTLPPTSASAKFHSLRSYFQVQEWIGADTDMQPTEWGWTLTNNRLMPVKTDLPPAPENLLNMVKCRCKQNCDSNRCTCRKNGLECTAGCAECQGISCTNTARRQESDVESDFDLE